MGHSFKKKIYPHLAMLPLNVVLCKLININLNVNGFVIDKTKKYFNKFSDIVFFFFNY